MPLVVPNFDPRRAPEILQDLVERARVHTPEWPLLQSDPGTTLLQLFAYLFENTLYIANRIPLRVQQRYLSLLGMGLRPAQAARGFVEFQNPKGALAVLQVPRDQTLTAGRVPFRTTNAVDVLPLEAQLFYKREPSRSKAEIDPVYKALFASFLQENEQLLYYETASFGAPASGARFHSLDLKDTIDGALWVALLARSADAANLANVRHELAGKTLTLGVQPALDATDKVLVSSAVEAGSSRDRLAVELPNPASSPLSPTYRELTPLQAVDLLENPGVVQFELPSADRLTLWDPGDALTDGVGELPPRLDDEELRARVVTWLRISRKDELGTLASQASTKLSWIGINAAAVVQERKVADERLPNGNGEPSQQVTLANPPVIADSLRLTVNGELWRRVETLTGEAPEVLPLTSGVASIAKAPTLSTSAEANVYVLDPESGVVRFGDGVSAGRRPPSGAAIQASYASGGGLAGLVEIDAINRAPGLTSELKVRNPIPTFGASAGETVEQALSRIPSELRHHGQMVSREDIEDIVAGTPGVSVGRTEVLPLVHPDQPLQDSPGVVTVLVIPARDPVHPDAPEADRLFLQTVCQHLEPRRLVTTEVHVVGPRYRPVWISVGVEVVPGRDFAALRPELLAAVKRFFHPLHGGFEGRGWPLGKAVESREVLVEVARVSGVSEVLELLVSEGGAASDVLELGRLELPHLIAVEVTAGPAVPIASVIGHDPEELPTAPPRRPVPLFPEEC